MIKMNERWGELFVGLAFCLRATSLLFGKIAMKTMGPFLLMGFRFLIAFVVIGFLFRKTIAKATKQELLHSAIIGLLTVLSIVFELRGLQTTDTSVTAFLEGTVVIMVPIITCIISRKLPDKLTVWTTLIALVGVALLTLKDGHLGFTSGEITIVFGTLWYSFYIILTDNFVKTDDAGVLAIMQMLFIAIFSFIGAFAFEDIRLPQGGNEWMSVLALAIICSGVGFTLQPLGQKYTSPERVSILSLLNPVTAAVLGVVFLSESMSLTMVAGAVLILISILAPTLVKQKQESE